MFNKIQYFLIFCCTAFAPALHAQTFSEADVYAYRNTMAAAGQALQQGNAAAAFSQIRQMAEKGFPEAQYILATLYQDGEGVAQNTQEAQRWYQAAAQNDNAAVAKLAKEALSELTH